MDSDKGMYHMMIQYEWTSLMNLQSEGIFTLTISQKLLIKLKQWRGVP